MTESFLILNSGDYLLLNTGDKLMLNITAVSGVNLSGNHSKVFYGDARFDKKREREEFVYSWPATARVQLEDTFALKSRIEIQESVTPVVARILKKSGLTIMGRIFRESRFGLASNITHIRTPVGKEAAKVQRRRQIKHLIYEYLKLEDN